MIGSNHHARPHVIGELRAEIWGERDPRRQRALELALACELGDDDALFDLLGGGAEGEAEADLVFFELNEAYHRAFPGVCPNEAAHRRKRPVASTAVAVYSPGQIELPPGYRFARFLQILFGAEAFNDIYGPAYGDAQAKWQAAYAAGNPGKARLLKLRACGTMARTAAFHFGDVVVAVAFQILKLALALLDRRR